MCCNQVYIGIEGLEQSLGLDPNDPIVPFVLFLGTSATLWYAYLSELRNISFLSARKIKIYCMRNLYFLSDLVQGLLLGLDL